MPEETAGGKDRAEQTVQAPTPGAATKTTGSPQSDPSAGAAVQPVGDGEREKWIPRERFDEVNTKAQQAEARLSQQQTQIVQMGQAIQNLSSRLNRPEPQPSGPTEDPLEALRPAYGSEEEGGTKVFETVTKTARIIAEQQDKALEARLEQRLEQIINQRVGGVTATLTVNNDIVQMQQKGLLSQQEANTLASRVAATVQENPDWQPHQQLLLSDYYRRMQLAGEIKGTQPMVQPKGTKPPMMAAGGGGGNRSMPSQQADSKAAMMEEVRQIKRMFRNTFGAMSDEDVAKYYIPPTDGVGVATTKDGAFQLPADVAGNVGDAKIVYQHTRER